MPKFSSGYSSKSNAVDNDKLLMADSEASNAIKSITKAALEKSLSGGTYANTIVYTASSTYAKPSKLKFIIVEVIGGGGGAGGRAASASGASAAGGNGGGGGYSRKKILASTLSASEIVSVGAGGTAGTSGGGAGGTGGTSSLGSYLQATGGGGGGPSASQGAGIIFQDGAAGDGGVGSGGDINLYGNPASPHICGPPRVTGYPSGSSIYAGGILNASAGSTGNNPAVAGRVPGGGAAGGTAGQSQGAAAGAIGGAGMVIIHEYY